MHDYFSQSVATQKGSIEAAAIQIGVDPVIIEKDLWVTVTLHALFSNIFQGIFVFKGGTSLSKVYGIIERFSEDIDVTINRSIFGKHLTLHELAELGTNERERIIENIKNKAHHYIQDQVIPLLKMRIEGISKEKVEVSFADGDPLSIEIYYPSFFKERYLYIKPRIYIEFGIRGELDPHETKVITSYLHQRVVVLNNMHVGVRVLSPIRTFYEKATLLHQETHRDSGKRTPLRLSRHYYDLHQLVLKGYLNEALGEMDLLEAVIKHKMLLFPSKWAQYETILDKGIKLLPDNSRIKDLEADYKQMEEMFFGEYPSFEEVLTTIKNIEQKVNTAIQIKISLS